MMSRKAIIQMMSFKGLCFDKDKYKQRGFNMLIPFFIKIGIIVTLLTFVLYDIQEAIEMFFLWVGVTSVYIICCAVRDTYINEIDDFIF